MNPKILKTQERKNQLTALWASWWRETQHRSNSWNVHPQQTILKMMHPSAWDHLSYSFSLTGTPGCPGRQFALIIVGPSQTERQLFQSCKHKRPCLLPRSDMCVVRLGVDKSFPPLVLLLINLINYIIYINLYHYITFTPFVTWMYTYIIMFFVFFVIT